MPRFNQSLSETQMWQISLMLANADKLTNSVTAVLAEQPGTPKPTSAGAGRPPKLQRGSLQEKEGRRETAGARQ